MRKSNPALILPSSLVAGARVPLRESFAAFVHALLRWRERARERRQLLSMTDRELRDIAITRVDAWREANKPLWRE